MTIKAKKELSEQTQSLKLEQLLNWQGLRRQEFFGNNLLTAAAKIN